MFFAVFRPARHGYPVSATLAFAKCDVDNPIRFSDQGQILRLIQ